VYDRKGVTTSEKTYFTMEISYMGKNVLEYNLMRRKVSRNPFQVEVEEKLGRNDDCWCGSGKKYKNCCGKNS